MPSPTSTLLPGVKDEPESAELASEAASKPTAAALLSLPTELLDRIARNVAPLGGKKAVNLRLVSRQLAVVASPVVLSSLLLPAHREQTDEILTVVLRDLNLTLVVTSVRYDVPDVEVTLVYAVLEAMKNLRRLSVVGNSYAAGAQLSNPFFTSLGRMKQLETLELRKIDLAGHRDLTSWIGARRLVVSYCPNSHIIFTDTRGNTKVSELQSLSYEDISVGTVDALNTLWSCSASASDVTIGWRVVTDSTLLPTFIDGVSWKPLTARRPLTLTLEGLLSLFDVSRGDHAFSTSVVVRVLNWITPLKVLSFPVHQTFSVADGFASLNLPALESLSLVRATWSSFGLQPDLLTMATYKHLVRLLSTSTLPALTTLHLRGWIDTTTVSTLASSSHHDLTREHPLIFSLLGFLRNTPIQELRLANSDGHPEDDVECVLSRVGDGEWEWRRVKLW